MTLNAIQEEVLVTYDIACNCEQSIHIKSSQEDILKFIRILLAKLN